MEKNYRNKWAVIVLAAGSSKRMGHDKALLKFDKYQTFIEKIIAEYLAAGCRNIIIVANENNNLLINRALQKMNIKGLQIIVNLHPEYERFYSIKLAAKVFTGEFCFIQDCDRPFINSLLIKKMIGCDFNGDYLIPLHKGQKGHPVLLKKTITGQMIKSKENCNHLKKFLETFSENTVETGSDAVIKNINNPKEYKEFVINTTNTQKTKSLL